MWEDLWRNDILPVSHRDRRKGLESGMRVCTWGTGEQERGRVCWLQARAVTDQSRVYFHMFCAESSAIISSRTHQEGTSWFAVLCGQHTLIVMDCATVEEEYKWDWTGAAITGEAWSVEGFVDEILENVLRVLIEPDLRLYFLRRRLHAHRHCCLTWIICVKWNMRDVEVLHG